LAAGAGHIEIVKYLVGAGVNINPRDRWGATPLNDAKDPAIAEFLSSHGAEKGVEQVDVN
jgi:ankyrin repeat protein